MPGEGLNRVRGKIPDPLAQHILEHVHVTRRPKGMRRPTYNRLTARYWAAEERLDEMIVDLLDKLMRRYGKIDFAA